MATSLLIDKATVLTLNEEEVKWLRVFISIRYFVENGQFAPHPSNHSICHGIFDILDELNQ